MELLEIDFLSSRYKILFDVKKNKYLVNDIITNKTKELKVGYNAKRDTHFIRYTYTSNGKRVDYQKTIDKIKWELFGEWPSENKTLIGLNELDCKRIIINDFENLGYLTPFSQMRDSPNPLMRKVHLYIERNGGLKLYLQLTREINLNSKIYYQDHNGRILKSSFEFKFFCILHYNGIVYQYEPFKVENFVPDFFIPKFNMLIEILGLGTRFDYNEKSKQKNLIYGLKGFNYEPIHVDGHNSTQSIFARCQEIFGKLKTPDFNKYFVDFSLNGDMFIDKLKDILQSINNGKLIIDDEENGNGFVQKHRTYYNYVYENYDSIFHSIKELIGYPSNYVNRPKNYWNDVENCKYELEEIFKREKHIPNVHQSQTTFMNIYVLNQFYSNWGVKSVNEGGIFYNHILHLKQKYGFRDLSQEQKDAKRNELENVIKRYYNGEMPLTGKNGIEKTHRWIYQFIKTEYGDFFNYIKKYFGYPPPHIQRPKGYYENEDNVRYELEENWRKYKRLLQFSEIKGKKGKDNTFNSLYSLVGIEQFRKGGKYFPFIEELKKKHGFTDVETNKINDFRKNVLVYLNGINEGKWNSSTNSCQELGKLQRYFKYVEDEYGSLFEGIKKEIGFPHPRVGRYKNYYADIDNCKYEIENNIRIFKKLPLYSQLKKPPYIGNNTLVGIFDKYKSSSFEEGGVFHKFTINCLKKYGKI